MQRSGDYVLSVRTLHGFELPDVFKLARADIDSLDRVTREAREHFCPVLFHCHRVRSLKLEVKALWVSKVLDGALGMMSLHEFHQ